MLHSRMRYMALAPALALALAAGLTACGSEGSDSAGVSSGGLTTIKLGLISPGTSGTPIYVAEEKGLLKDQKVNLSTQVLSGGATAAMAALASGSVDVLLGASTDIVQYAAQGVVNGKIFAEAEDNFYDLVATKGLSSPKDLEGKTIGISAPNGGDEVYIRALLKKDGVDTSKITFVTSGTGTQRLSALEAKTVSAIAVSHLNRTTSDQVGSVLVKAEDSPIQFPGSVFFASSDFLKNHSDALTGMAKAFGAAADWTRSNKDAAVPMCVKGTQATDQACAGAIKLATDPTFAGKYTWSSNFGVNSEGIQSAIDVVAEFVSPKAADIKVDTLVDQTIAG